MATKSTTNREYCCGCDLDQLKMAFRIYNAVASLGVVAVGIIGFEEGTRINQTQIAVERCMITLYLMVLGIVGIIAEAEVEFLLRPFGFLTIYFGKFGFYLFIATSMLIIGGGSAGSIIGGLLILGAAGCSLIMGFLTCGEVSKEELARREAERRAQNAFTGAQGAAAAQYSAAEQKFGAAQDTYNPPPTYSTEGPAPGGSQTADDPNANPFLAQA